MIMKAITDSKASEAQASSHMDQSISVSESPEKVDENIQIDLKLDTLEFLVELPTISAVDLDVLKLTAQFAAKNGKQFILHLSQKESRNPQFDFLKPHHHLHSFYLSLVNQYTLVLQPSNSLLERIKCCAFDRVEHLNLVKRRSQIERLERQRIQEQEAEQNAEKEAYNKIDWNDFSIAESVTFGPEDQHKDFPAPLNPQTLRSMSISQRLEMWTGRLSDQISGSNILEDQEGEEDEMEIDEPTDFSTPLIIPGNSTSSSNEIIMGSAFGSNSMIKVRTDYVPRGNKAAAVVTQICGICGASIPVTQIEEHMRIELLDPKWRTQKLAMLAKNRDSNLVETGTDVSKNLDAIAKHRSDIFSPTTGTSTFSSQIERGPTRPIWDGRGDSVGQINRAAQILARPQIEKEMEILEKSGDYSLNPNSMGPRQGGQPQAIYYQAQGFQTQPPPFQQSGYPPYHQGFHPFMPPPQNGFPFPPAFMPPFPPGSIPQFPPGPMPQFQFPPGAMPPFPPGAIGAIPPFPTGPPGAIPQFPPITEEKK